MICKSVLFTIGLLLAFMPEAKPSVEQQMERLQEAQDYLTVKPSHSLYLLETTPGIDTLPVGLKIRWHVLRVRASVPTNQLQLLEQSLEVLFTYNTHPYFINKLTSILSALGIWLRREGYLSEADISLQCALKYAENESQRLTLTNSRALVARHMGAHHSAIALYQQAALLAQKQGNTSMAATINNNLGAIALDLANYDEADRYFRAALQGYQSVDKRSGHITAGTNLLFLFVLKGESINYARLYSPIKALTDSFPNQAKKAFLHWIHQTYLTQQGYDLSADERNVLQVQFKQLESEQVRTLVATHLAPQVKVTVPAVREKQSQPFQMTWFEKVRLCDW
ncbi:tetratricopeptide repeat protein [Pseudoalteromonas luteoviolacea]|uniref:Uncharacterized protein n=1 Tax=Pseudoalteromonas luteoviolacea S4054 TaxID=1129367 RepID=A0A0F6ABX7_9GAMM|nr:tetratricopeptide repeat protein [Pseudoalteromonas luteoviolacea]AOT10839.1 hypothetical protein S4054249_23625 [Pseudoalteromonas luteoviolacea]AOT15999.1 hypothetical protein S40542_24885 [Pseudoalteromonas luteoviolacea]AOT20660.1 hypothetical protein S4054_23545 [Pseudoalteromonas luteoviolacea]KKE82889.1 hypothetical protein N479_16585 [Pseudoalteromonas luteoviolacea S4054]KZN75230.1 hypothetical protein N481_07900 [Pseudoalteromonas luteoviolacea S4047-1]